MTKEEHVVESIEAKIDALPPASREQCVELANHIMRMVESAGNPVGPLAVAVVGAQIQMNTAKAQART